MLVKGAPVDCHNQAIKVINKCAAGCNARGGWKTIPIYGSEQGCPIRIYTNVQFFISVNIYQTTR